MCILSYIVFFFLLVVNATSILVTVAILHLHTFYLGR